MFSVSIAALALLLLLLYHWLTEWHIHMHTHDHRRRTFAKYFHWMWLHADDHIELCRHGCTIAQQNKYQFSIFVSYICLFFSIVMCNTTAEMLLNVTLFAVCGWVRTTPKMDDDLHKFSYTMLFFNLQRCIVKTSEAISCFDFIVSRTIQNDRMLHMNWIVRFRIPNSLQLIHSQ